MPEVNEINSLNRLSDFRYRWNNILQKSKDNDVFSTWEWLSCWWKHFGNGRQLKVLVAEEKDEILGIAPLMLSKYDIPIFGKISRVEFIGSAESDYNNFILLKKEKDALKLFLDYLMDQSDWDILQLRDLRDDALAARMLSNGDIGQLFNLEKRVMTLCPYIILPNSISVLMERWSGNMRRNISRRTRKLHQTHHVKFKTHMDFGSVNEAMKVFIDLHQKRWKSQGEPGAFASKSFRDFHTDVAELLANRNWLSLCFLMADDEPVATIYSFDYNYKGYEYLTGFNPAYETYGVGNIVKKLVIERCIQRGFREYDLLRGSDPYKMDWTTEIRKNYEIQFTRNRFGAKIYTKIRKSKLRNFISRLHVLLSLSR